MKLSFACTLFAQSEVTWLAANGVDLYFRSCSLTSGRHSRRCVSSRTSGLGEPVVVNGRTFVRRWYRAIRVHGSEKGVPRGRVVRCGVLFAAEERAVSVCE